VQTWRALEYSRIDHDHEVLAEGDEMHGMGVCDNKYMRKAKLIILSEFKKLHNHKNLTIKMNALFGTENEGLGLSSPGKDLSRIMPDSLEELTVICDDEKPGSQERALLSGSSAVKEKSFHRIHVYLSTQRRHENTGLTRRSRTLGLLWQTAFSPHLWI